MTDAAPRTLVSGLAAVPGIAVLVREPIRLFAVLGLGWLALMPVLGGVGALVAAPETDPAAGLWRLHETMVGGFGAILAGLVLTFAADRADRPLPAVRTLLALAGLWAGARIVGLSGIDGLRAAAGVLEAAFLGAVLVQVISAARVRAAGQLLPVAGWIVAVLVADGWGRLALLDGDGARLHAATTALGLAFAGLFGFWTFSTLVVVTNLVLDPTERTSPYRPHPGRAQLAPGLVLLALAGPLAGLSAAAIGWLWVAAGAAFLDRVSEAFIGREGMRAEIAALAGSSALAGLALIMGGAAGLGADLADRLPLLALVHGGLGLGLLAVMAAAGRLHTGRALAFDGMTRSGLALAAVAGLAALVLPDALGGRLPGLLTGAGAALVLASLWPALTDAATLGHRCGRSRRG